MRSVESFKYSVKIQKYITVISQVYNSCMIHYFHIAYLLKILYFENPKISKN